ncbi:MAG: hypothetical protein AAF915_15700 [Cyanobacteria bacterium P01_D01_bin.50]
MRFPLLRKYDEYLITREGAENKISRGTGKKYQLSIPNLYRDFSDGEPSPSVPLPPPIYQSPRSKLLWFQKFILLTLVTNSDNKNMKSV